MSTLTWAEHWGELTSGALLGSDRPIPLDRDRILALLAQPQVDAYFATAGIDRDELRKWFIDKSIEKLNEGKTVPASQPNTDFFPRDEYRLNRLWSRSY